MKLTGNTIFITGGGSGIGRGLAEAFHKRGNRVIIAGRRKGLLEETARSNPGMESVELDVDSPASIARVANHLVTRYPELNVLVNNAGIMKMDNVSEAVDDAVLVSTVATNLMGPIRMTSALVEHLKRQTSATVINVSSGLAFVPLTATAVYSATKAAVHSYTLSLRYKLRDTSVRVVEVAPPWVQTDLLDSRNEPRAMPLEKFIEGTLEALGTNADEALVERVRMLRNNPGPGEAAFVTHFNDMMTQRH
jgi:uncharacterized oxidoreductase